jgi:hypothetical protein
MNRRLFNFVAATSLMLCVATVVLWVRSQFRWDQIVVDTPGSWFQIGLRTGGISLNRFIRATPSKWRVRREGPFQGKQNLVNLPDMTFANWLGFHSFHRGGEHAMTVPYWAICLPLALSPGLWVLRWNHRRRRSARGLCPSCGYDLRATPERCPECGVVPQTTARTAG